MSRDTDYGVYLRRKLFLAGMLLLMNTFQHPEGRLQQVEGTQKLVELQTTSVKPVEDQQTEHEADVGEEEVSNEEPQQQQDLPISIKRLRREIRKPARFEDMVAYEFPVVV